MDKDCLPIDAPERREIARRAACQIEALALSLKRAAHDDGDELAELALSLAVRFGQLATVVMGAVGDELSCSAEMERVLYG